MVLDDKGRAWGGDILRVITRTGGIRCRFRMRTGSAGLFADKKSAGSVRRTNVCYVIVRRWRCSTLPSVV